MTTENSILMPSTNVVYGLCAKYVFGEDGLVRKYNQTHVQTHTNNYANTNYTNASDDAKREKLYIYRLRDFFNKKISLTTTPLEPGSIISRLSRTYKNVNGKNMTMTNVCYNVKKDVKSNITVGKEEDNKTLEIKNKTAHMFHQHLTTFAKTTGEKVLKSLNIPPSVLDMTEYRYNITMTLRELKKTPVMLECDDFKKQVGHEIIEKILRSARCKISFDIVNGKYRDHKNVFTISLKIRKVVADNLDGLSPFDILLLNQRENKKIVDTFDIRQDCETILVKKTHKKNSIKNELLKLVKL